jgi:hypothetical protein
MSLCNLNNFGPIVSSTEYYRIGDTVKIKNRLEDDEFECFNYWNQFYLVEIKSNFNGFRPIIIYSFSNKFLHLHLRTSLEGEVWQCVRSRNILIEKKYER